MRSTSHATTGSSVDNVPLLTTLLHFFHAKAQRRKASALRNRGAFLCVFAPLRETAFRHPLSLQTRVQLLQYDLVELGSDRLQLDLRNHLFRETVSQQAAPKLGTNPARLEIKQLFRLDLPHRR